MSQRAARQTPPVGQPPRRARLPRSPWRRSAWSRSAIRRWAFSRWAISRWAQVRCRAAWSLAVASALVIAGCSTNTVDQQPCSADDQCTSAFGPGSTCNVAAGVCEPGQGIEPRLGFIYSSSENDQGWSQTHHDAALAVAEAIDAPLFFRPAVQSPDVETVIDELVTEDDANIFFTLSSGFITGTLNAANRYPDRTFFSCCGDASGDNLNSFFGRMYQPIYVLGYVAARMSCTKRLGVVAALPLPQFIRHINAFTLGAREADPRVEVDVRWVGAFFNPEVEGALAEDLIDEGADVILAQSNSTAPLQARAGERVTCASETGDREVDVYRVGYHSPTACEANPEQCIAAAHWNWAGLYEGKVRAVLDGTLDYSDTSWGSMTNDSTSVVNYSEIASFVPVAITAEATPLREATIADPQVPFRGPLADNTGTTQIASGQELSEADFERMCWFVEGVVSTESGDVEPAVVPSSCGGI
ncbi:MAG: BMP family ABC transporter substrate-binding protein [Myxococcota bacterium]